MARKPKKVPNKIVPREMKLRDLLMVRLINGVTKAGTHVDRKKRATKYKARSRVRPGEDE